MVGLARSKTTFMHALQLDIGSFLINPHLQLRGGRQLAHPNRLNFNSFAIQQIHRPTPIALCATTSLPTPSFWSLTVYTKLDPPLRQRVGVTGNWLGPRPHPAPVKPSQA